MSFPGNRHGYIVGGNAPYSRAFTLIELMVVVAILVLVTAFIGPAVTGLSSSSGLSSGGRIVSNLLTVARSEAINRHASVRFEVATIWPADSSLAYRKVALVQHNFVSNTDTQLTNWQTLPDGVGLKDPAGAPASGKYFFAASQSQSPKLTFGGQTITSSYLEFSPTGAPNIDPASAPVRVRVVDGYVKGGSLTQAFSNNYYEIDVDGLVGKTQINRP